MIGNKKVWVDVLKGGWPAPNVTVMVRLIDRNVYAEVFEASENTLDEILHDEVLASIEITNDLGKDNGKSYWKLREKGVTGWSLGLKQVSHWRRDTIEPIKKVSRFDLMEMEE